MRIPHFLFVVPAVLLSSCNAIPTTTDEGQAKVAMVTSTGIQVPARAIDISNGKRFLRPYYNEDKNEEDEEERAVMDKDQVAKWTDRAKHWVERGYTPASLKEKLVGLSGVLSDKNEEKYKLFLKAWNRQNPRGLD